MGSTGNVSFARAPPRLIEVGLFFLERPDAGSYQTGAGISHKCSLRDDVSQFSCFAGETGYSLWQSLSKEDDPLPPNMKKYHSPRGKRPTFRRLTYALIAIATGVIAQLVLN